MLTSVKHTMLHHVGMLKSLWVEAFSTAMYIGNRMLVKALDGHTYHERLYNVRLDPVTLHVFGVLCAILGLSKAWKKCVLTMCWATNISRACSDAGTWSWPGWPIEGKVFEF